ncbi:hypothetical protein CR513_14822, partial [Mucuna pruriens]
MMDQRMIDVASGGALMDKMPVAAKHLISNMASKTQQFGIKGETPSQMVNEVSMVDNLRLENQLIELTLLVRLLPVRQQQPSMETRVYNICTFVEYPTNMCPILQETESNHLESVGSIESNRTRVSHMIVNNLEGNNTDRIQFKGNIQLINSDSPKVHLRVKIAFNRIRDTKHHHSNRSNNREGYHRATHHL